ncbi:MAG: spore maturation protein [Symbiobacteriia bacterium]
MTVAESVARWVIPAMVVFIPLYGFAKGVKVYDAFIEGAVEGLRLVVRIAPYMLAILVALGLFRASGALDLFVALLRPVLSRFGVPPEVVPLLLTRPLSGGASLGVLAEILRVSGPDSFIGRLASIIQGSTDTTFYVLAVYFGSISIKKTRYALTLGLAADFAGFVAALWIASLFFPH